MNLTIKASGVEILREGNGISISIINTVPSQILDAIPSSVLLQYIFENYNKEEIIEKFKELE